MINKIVEDLIIVWDYQNYVLNRLIHQNNKYFKELCTLYKYYKSVLANSSRTP